ncbi:DUF4240 domain-containing protein [Streptomyces phyllanthi]|uniref:DUF4240 domain-containing protein n=1 Tax=Streptomyces phyllanthi TaxID=1803180 RepID=A0A5N8W674_9ACTN|nr:DUF4240 domain-containing protein [Streptomyces phyllanthi]MPY41848.1 DUF4240 domain-containing protein [Streptomyces phyllanthi]
MDDETFWHLIEGCRQQTQDPDERLAWLGERLARGPESEIVGFRICLHRVLAPTFTWDLWAAADRIMGWSSDDVFFGFRLWLVGMGRDTFERVARDPDGLADVPEVRRLAGRSPWDWEDEECPDWEELDYVAEQAFTEVTGGSEEDFYAAFEEREDEEREDEEREGEDCEPLEPAGERWDGDDDEQAARRLPRLGALFPGSKASAGAP